MKNKINRHQDAVGKQTLKIISEVGSSYNNLIYSKIKPFLGKKILEVGSGIGNISSYLVKDFYDKEILVLSDISPWCLKKLKEKFGRLQKVKVLTFDLRKSPNKKLLNFKFDTIICLNVLEHLSNDQKALSNMEKALKKGGKLILMTPALQFAYGELDRSLGHYRRYNLKNLNRALEKLGFRAVHNQYLNFLSLWGWWFSSRILKRKSFPKNQFGLFSKIYQWLHPLEALFPLPCGLACFLVAEKS